MFNLDLNVKMQIQVSDELNERLENGGPEAFLELEAALIQTLAPSRGRLGFVATKLQIEDAGPYNDAGNWEPSKFHD